MEKKIQEIFTYVQKAHLATELAQDGTVKTIEHYKVYGNILQALQELYNMLPRPEEEQQNFSPDAAMPEEQTFQSELVE